MMCPMEAEGNADLLLDYAAGKLKADIREQMEQHMKICAACGQLAGAQSSVWNALDEWEPAEVSLDFDRRLYARIEQQQAPWWTRWMRPFNPLFRHAVPIAAAAGVIVMAGLVIYRPYSAPTAPVPTSAQVEALQPEQLQGALEEMETLREFNHLVPDTADSKM
jgi:anti-sigma factor RsiW